MLSAIDVSNESMEPNARIMAYSIMIGYKEGSIFNIPSKIEGKPEGIFPIKSHLILKNKLLTMQQQVQLCAWNSFVTLGKI
jgi:hypothetical protein